MSTIGPGAGIEERRSEGDSQGSGEGELNDQVADLNKDKKFFNLPQSPKKRSSMFSKLSKKPKEAP